VQVHAFHFILIGNDDRGRNQIRKHPWTQNEKDAVAQHLGKFLRLQKCPGKNDCDVARADPRLQNRSWKSIKYYVKNVNQLQKRK